ncbi:ArsR family transcriptional regulator [Streptomyces sp. WG4]|uniref:ArsR family transcriptional regulator n=1 Tax=Streptomyces sp. WG4 TaxID=3417649 RepID=UPI00358E654D
MHREDLPPPFREPRTGRPGCHVCTVTPKPRLVSRATSVRASARAGGAEPRRVAGTHLALLARLGLLRATRIRRRTYCRRDEVRFAEVARLSESEKGW